MLLSCSAKAGTEEVKISDAASKQSKNGSLGMKTKFKNQKKNIKKKFHQEISQTLHSVNNAAGISRFGEFSWRKAIVTKSQIARLLSVQLSVAKRKLKLFGGMTASQIVYHARKVD